MRTQISVYMEGGGGKSESVFDCVDNANARKKQIKLLLFMSSVNVVVESLGESLHRIFQNLP